MFWAREGLTPLPSRLPPYDAVRLPCVRDWASSSELSIVPRLLAAFGASEPMRSIVTAGDGRFPQVNTHKRAVNLLLAPLL
eukprot:4792768-Pleurochrysis_carterae.AAC.3